MAGASAREQPLRGSRVAEGGVPPSGRDELADEGGEGVGQHNGFASEPECEVLLGGVNVVQGEAADRCGPLGVEQDEKPGDAVFGFDALFVQ